MTPRLNAPRMCSCLSTKLLIAIVVGILPYNMCSGALTHEKSIRSITPSLGGTAGGDTITVSGVFASSTSNHTVQVNGLNCTSTVHVDDFTLTCVTPASATSESFSTGNNISVWIEGSGDAWTYISPEPLLELKVTPTASSLMLLPSGGESTNITLSAPGLTTVPSSLGVTIGGSPCTSAVLYDANTVGCIGTPSGGTTADLVDVYITADSQTSLTGAVVQYVAAFSDIRLLIGNGTADTGLLTWSAPTLPSDLAAATTYSYTYSIDGGSTYSAPQGVLSPSATISFGFRQSDILVKVTATLTGSRVTPASSMSVETLVYLSATPTLTINSFAINSTHFAIDYLGTQQNMCAMLLSYAELSDSASLTANQLTSSHIFCTLSASRTQQTHPVSLLATAPSVGSKVMLAYISAGIVSNSVSVTSM